MRRDVGGAVDEAGGTGEHGNHFVVHHVVFAGVGEDEGGGDAAEEVDGFLHGRFVVDDQAVALVEAVVDSADHGRGFGGFGGSNRGDVEAVVGHGAAVAGGGGGDVDFPAGFGEADECAAAEDFGVVGMGQECNRSVH